MWIQVTQSCDLERHVEASHEGMIEEWENESIWGNNWFWNLFILVVNVKNEKNESVRPLEELSTVGMIEEWEKRIYWENSWFWNLFILVVSVKMRKTNLLDWRMIDKIKEHPCSKCGFKAT